MARIVIELTNRCNLRCRHCYAERHAGSGDLSLEVLEKILRQARLCDINHVCFTGGEPTLHRQFDEIIAKVSDAGYTFSFVTNGTSLVRHWPQLRRYRSALEVVTFSLDGAREETHDRLRGPGSFRRVIRATMGCLSYGLPFTLNMVITAESRDEVEEMIALAGRLGSRGVRFTHLMPTPDTASRQLDLSPRERRAVEADIWRLQPGAPVVVGMAPGYFSQSPFFPCAPLELQEFNVDYRGNLTLCCQLSGYAPDRAHTDVIANLHEVSLADACARFRERVATYLAEKRRRVARGELSALDHFPCWYCVKYLDKVRDLDRIPAHPWAHARPASVD